MDEKCKLNMQKRDETHLEAYHKKIKKSKL
jgi:hypothetical protein